MSLEEGQKLSRKEREMALHRAEILEAAERVFADSGFVSAKMEEIARQAEFSVGMLYKFFKSKEELYTELLHDKLEVMGVRLYSEMQQAVPPVEKVRNLFRARMEMVWEHRTFFRIFFHGTTLTVCDPRAGFSAEAWERYQAFLKDQEAVFQEGIDCGEFRDVGASMLTLTFEGILRAYADWLTRDDRMARDLQQEEALLEIFMRGATPA